MKDQQSKIKMRPLGAGGETYSISPILTYDLQLALQGGQISSVELPVLEHSLQVALGQLEVSNMHFFFAHALLHLSEKLTYLFWRHTFDA